MEKKHWISLFRRLIITCWVYLLYSEILIKKKLMCTLKTIVLTLKSFYCFPHCKPAFVNVVKFSFNEKVLINNVMYEYDCFFSNCTLIFQKVYTFVRKQNSYSFGKRTLKINYKSLFIAFLYMYATYMNYGTTYLCI